MKKTLCLASFTVGLAACAGKVDYVLPSAAQASSNQKIVERPREAVWNASVPELGKQFFVVNNIDKSSGFINVSYTGDPESYIDCGRISSYVKNARGERTYEFAGAKAQQSYEMMVPNGLFLVNRKMSLEGRVNLVFEDMGPSQTRVTANTRYVVNRSISSQHVGGSFPQIANDSISFNSGGHAFFPTTADGRATECVSTGKLEREILSVIH